MAQTPAYPYGEGVNIDFTPVADVNQGDVVVLAPGLVGIAIRDTPAGTEGSATIRGLFEMPKVTGAIAAFALIYWDADANPLGGTAGSGAITTTATGNTFMGYALKAAAETAQSVFVLFADGRNVAPVVAPLAQDISAAYVEAEVQAISTKVDAILTALKTAGLMASA